MTWLRRAALAVLERNWREGETPDGVRFAFARPDRDKFPAQFLWDSCFHAIAWSRIDPQRGARELRSLVTAQEPDGHIGHTIFWDAPIRASRRPFYNVSAPTDRMTRTIQPPFLGLAWREVADRLPTDERAAFAEEGREPISRYHAWLSRERDPEGTSLLRLIQPDESGLDASPKFDRPMGLEAAGLPGFIRFVRRSRRGGFRLDGESPTGFDVEEVLTSTAYALSLAASGDGAAAARVTDALVERTWDDRRGLFLDRARDGSHLGVSTWASLAPLALPDLPRSLAVRLVEEHVMRPDRYWLRFPIPSTAADERAYRPRTRLLRYWRGPTWIAGSWLVHRGLLQHGFSAEARELGRRTEELIARSGFREYYDPERGDGMGAPAFGMSTLAAVICEA